MGINGEALVLLTVILAGLFVVVVIGLPALLLHAREQARVSEREHALKLQELELKRDMIAKGLPSEEIERVVRAAGVKSAPPALAGTFSGPGFDKTRLLQTLIEAEMEPAHIEQVLRALAECNDAEMPAKLAAISSMVEAEMAAPDIIRVLRAFDHEPHLDVRNPLPTAFRE